MVYVEVRFLNVTPLWSNVFILKLQFAQQDTSGCWIVVEIKIRLENQPQPLNRFPLFSKNSQFSLHLKL